MSSSPLVFAAQGVVVGAAIFKLFSLAADTVDTFTTTTTDHNAITAWLPWAATALRCCGAYCAMLYYGRGLGGSGVAEKAGQGPTPVRAEELLAAGLSSPAGRAGNARAMYLDLLRRAVMNLLYSDMSIWCYDGRKTMRLLNRFDLQRRLAGEDMPLLAHTMVGQQRLLNIEQLAQRVIDESVQGDLIETGVLRGGSALFMKGVLAANGDQTRRVFLCDTFNHGPPPAPLWARLTVLPLIRALASIPVQAWQKAFFRFLLNSQGDKGSFPRSDNPSDDTLLAGVFLLQTIGQLPVSEGFHTSLDGVRATFAKYGLLDERVHFLRGFFSRTLPPAIASGEITKLALIRLDGDTYESTITAIEPLYPLLSRGGFCIVDDYYSFEECRRAIDEYRSKHGITAPIQRIDALSVYWRNE
jgi:O-methyltransferase